ncbi:MAG: cupredoxin domain-containing protein [Nitrososphaeraceae archaeon]|nr:cupredoxin domain-containing protein [Nitrososphaeraceae archaeon]
MKVGLISIVAGLVIFMTMTLSLNNNFVFAQQNMTEFVSSIPYYLFPAEIEDVEEEILKIPHDAFTLQNIIANQGENVSIKFYNTEAEEAHSFTLDSPYNINADLKGNENTTINFVADKPGIYTYYCIYHLPTMTGKLVVLPQSQEAK